MVESQQASVFEVGLFVVYVLCESLLQHGAILSVVGQGQHCVRKSLSTKYKLMSLTNNIAYPQSSTIQVQFLPHPTLQTVHGRLDTWCNLLCPTHPY